MTNALTAEMKDWLTHMYVNMGGSQKAIAQSTDLTEGEVISVVSKPLREPTGDRDLAQALQYNNSELTAFWGLYCESWRLTQSPLAFAITYSHFSKMRASNSHTTFDAALALKAKMLAGEGVISSCQTCGQIRISIPSLVKTTQILSCGC